MMLPLQNIPPQSLQVHLNTTALRGQLLAQMEKDLSANISEIAPTDAHFFEKLHDFLYRFLDDLLAHTPKRLGDVLYRVDIAEHKAQKFLEVQNPIQALSDGILQREMLKIVVRNVHNGTLKL